jgi:aryl-alcohol dehydrogenase-like predicted oxidoreductase
MNPFKTKLSPSRIFLGTCAYGSSIPEESAFAVMDAYHAVGGNVIDTAHVYSQWEPGGAGTSERTVGAWLRSRGVRDEIIVSTKGGHPPMDDMAHGRCALADLRADLSESLERLELDFVDLYWLHRDHPELPVEAIMDNLAALYAEGHVGCFGASNWLPERIEAANRYAQSQGMPTFAASQPGWSLAERETETGVSSPMLYLSESMRQWHIRTGFPLAPYSAQATGYFGAANGRWALDGFPGTVPRSEAYDSPANRRRLQTALAMAREKGCTANQIALAYALHQPFPCFPIVSTRHPEHIQESMGALEVALSAEECDFLRGETL